ncbi:MAG: UDP-N-acetylmuramate dehydrogenase [Bacteroidales bacterium]|nr:UDP-N-acetylmuramate dehydrogenase [Clostridium sp.]MCM1203480.1 UDP-N-acetylmuramate dehydrogenase [Bacteroidales bacterium]
MVGKMSQNLINELYRIVGEQNVRLDEPMAKHTTFRIGGPAKCFVTPQTTEEIGQVVLLCNAEKVPFFVMGHGSNLLVSDAGMEGVVIQLYQNYAKFSVEGSVVRAQAGIMLHRLGNALMEAELTGFEFAAGIPGTLGGAVMMNAGAYGGEMKDIVTAVQLMDKNGNLFEKDKEEMEFSYRHSIVEDGQYIVLGASLRLEPGKREEIAARMEELATARKAKQPLEFPSAGSTFKRPEGYFAGKLIMDAGLRGHQVGGAQISEKHCGFVVNKGDATAEDVMKLIDEVKDKVYEQFQVELEPEVRLVGRI